MFKNNSQETKSLNKRTEDGALKLQIQQERDFMIAQALMEGRGSEVFDINGLPDAHFEKVIKNRARH